MTNEELLATAEVALIKASRRKKDIVDLQRAINTLDACIKDVDESTARAVFAKKLKGKAR